MMNFIHHNVAKDSKKYTTMETVNRETDKILTNLHSFFFCYM